MSVFLRKVNGGQKYKYKFEIVLNLRILKPIFGHFINFSIIV